MIQIVTLLMVPFYDIKSLCFITTVQYREREKVRCTSCIEIKSDDCPIIRMTSYDFDTKLKILQKISFQMTLLLHYMSAGCDTLFR